MQRDSNVIVNGFSERLRAARLVRGIPSIVLSREAGLSRGTVSEIERGSTKTVTLRTAIRLADALDVPRAWLCLGEGKCGPVERSTDPIPETKAAAVS